MPTVSGGQIKMAAQTSWSSADGFAHSGGGSHPLAKYLAQGHAYDTIYEKQLWPSVAVNKLTGLQILLPGKTYRRLPMGREDGRMSPFGRLMARPSTTLNPLHFWGWFIGMHWVHGRAFARKRRDRIGRPFELELIHPTRMRYGPRNGGHVSPGAGLEQGPNRWWFCHNDGTESPIDRREFIYWPRFNPHNPQLGLSPMEPLRDTLANEAGARTANLAQWHNGGRPSFVLTHPKVFNNPKVTKNLASQFEERHGGVEQWGRPLVLQEGMEAVPLTSDLDLQYIETRKLNREEVAAAYDIPPPAIHILDQATFSNITEQMRMLYRQTMAPPLNTFEAMIDFDLRDGSFGQGPPDFGEAFYFEWLVDGVQRGSFEARTEAYAKAIGSGQMTPAEVRDLENRPFIEGSDQLFVNGSNKALVADAVAAAGKDPKQLAEIVQKLYLGTPEKLVISTEEARGILRDAGANLSGQAPTLNAGPSPAPAVASSGDWSTVMGRLSRPQSIDDIDVDHLIDGLGEAAANAVRGAYDIAVYGECSVGELRQIIKEIGL